MEIDVVGEHKHDVVMKENISSVRCCFYSHMNIYGSHESLVQCSNFIQKRNIAAIFFDEHVDIVG